jgi:hypothetical protein
MSKYKTKNNLFDSRKLFKERIFIIEKDLDNGSQYLSDFSHKKTIQEVAIINSEYEEILETPIFDSARLRKINVLCERVGKLIETNSSSRRKYHALLDMFETAQSGLNIGNKYTSQWSLIESEYKICLEAVKFRNNELYAIVFDNIKSHITQLQEQIKLEKLKAIEETQKLISDIESIVDDDLTEFVLAGETLEFLLDRYDELRSNMDGQDIFTVNLISTQQQVEDAKTLLFVCNNQIQILTKIDKFIKSRSSTNHNPYFTVLTGEKMKEVDNYGEYYERSIRAINR